MNEIEELLNKIDDLEWSIDDSQAEVETLKLRIREIRATEHGINLPEKQLIIYKWFLKRGLTGTFNKPLIVCETGIHYETIRMTLRKFDKLKILNISYDTCMKEYDYKINKTIVIKNN